MLVDDYAGCFRLHPFTATGAVYLPGEWPGDTRHGRRRVYQKPKVERFGTFRELTQVGFQGTSDGFTICGTAPGTGNDLCGTEDNPCTRGSV